MSAVISVVCLGLLIEAPEDFMYYWSMRAWTELSMICLVIVTTIFWVTSHILWVCSEFSPLMLGYTLALDWVCCFWSRPQGIIVWSLWKQTLLPASLSPWMTCNIRYMRCSINCSSQFYPFVLMVKIATDNLTFVNTGIPSVQIFLTYSTYKRGFESVGEVRHIRCPSLGTTNSISRR